jgi:hypothetical protein
MVPSVCQEKAWRFPDVTDLGAPRGSTPNVLLGSRTARRVSPTRCQLTMKRELFVWGLVLFPPLLWRRPSNKEMLVASMFPSPSWRPLYAAQALACLLFWGLPRSTMVSKLLAPSNSPIPDSPTPAKDASMPFSICIEHRAAPSKCQQA